MNTRVKSMLSCIKFFDRDVIGAYPARPGDTFKAQFFGAIHTFRVVEFVGGNTLMAELLP